LTLLVTCKDAEVFVDQLPRKCEQQHVVVEVNAKLIKDLKKNYNLEFWSFMVFKNLKTGFFYPIF